MTVFKLARKLLAYGLGILCAIALWAWISTDIKNADAMSSKAYCRAPVLRNYEVGLQNLPPVVEVPASGRLPFAPPDIRFVFISLPPNGSHLLAGDGSLGYIIQATDGTRLNWTVSSQLVRVSANGDDRDIVDRASDNVEDVSSQGNVSLILKVPGDPGRYRYDMSIFLEGGDLLGKFSRYVQVVRPTLVTRIGIATIALKPGSLLVSRIENLGSVPIEHNGRYEIQRKVGPDWQSVAKGSSKRGFHPSHFIRGGASSGCERVRLNPALPSGRYRIMRFFERGDTPPDSHSLFRRLAEFRVKGTD